MSELHRVSAEETLTTLPEAVASETGEISWPERLRRLFQSRLRRPRQLQLRETLALGERRFVALIEFEGSRFLVGGTSASLCLLARVDRDEGAPGSSFPPIGNSPEPGVRP